MTNVKTLNILKPYSILDLHATLSLLTYRLAHEPYQDGQDCLNGMIHDIKQHAKKHPKDVYIYTEIGNSDYNGWCFNVGDGDPVELKQYREYPSKYNWHIFKTSKLSYSLHDALKRVQFIKNDIHIHPKYYECVSGYDTKTIQKDGAFIKNNRVHVLNV